MDVWSCIILECCDLLAMAQDIISTMSCSSIGKLELPEYM